MTRTARRKIRQTVTAGDDSALKLGRQIISAVDGSYGQGIIVLVKRRRGKRKRGGSRGRGKLFVKIEPVVDVDCGLPHS